MARNLFCSIGKRKEGLEDRRDCQRVSVDIDLKIKLGHSRVSPSFQVLRVL